MYYKALTCFILEVNINPSFIEWMMIIFDGCFLMGIYVGMSIRLSLVCRYHCLVCVHCVMFVCLLVSGSWQDQLLSYAALWYSNSCVFSKSLLFFWWIYCLRSIVIWRGNWVYQKGGVGTNARARGPFQVPFIQWICILDGVIQIIPEVMLHYHHSFNQGEININL